MKVAAVESVIAPKVNPVAELFTFTTLSALPRYVPAATSIKDKKSFATKLSAPESVAEVTSKPPGVQTTSVTTVIDAVPPTGRTVTAI